MIKKSQKRYLFNSGAEIKIAHILAENWFAEYNIDEFANSFNFGRATVYRSIKTLSERGLISKNKNLITINKKSNITYNFKKLVDSYKLEQLDEKTKNIILDVYNSIREEAKGNIRAFLVIGSVVRNEHKKESDVDFLVLLKKEQDIIKNRIMLYEKMNIVIKTEAQFEKEYIESDDFILSSLINNLVIFDDGFWKKFLLNSLPPVSERILNLRQEQLEKLKKRLYDMLKIGDNKGLIEEYKKYLILGGRIKLLKEGVIPGTKNQIFNALKSIDKTVEKNYHSVNEKNIKDKVLKIE